MTRADRRTADQRRILAFLATAPYQDWYGHDLSRATGLRAARMYAALADLEAADVVVRGVETRTDGAVPRTTYHLPLARLPDARRLVLAARHGARR